MTGAEQRAGSFFSRWYGHPQSLIWSAPGRVNLIGEHTDYNDGFVLPFALPHRTAVAARPTGAAQWTVASESLNQAVTFDGADLGPGRVGGWAAYVAGVVWALTEAGVEVPGAELAICSDVPLGAGLSSSAALECAVLAALADLAGGTDSLPRERWPALAQRAENAYVGVPSGIMDQSAATLCREGHALYLDCRSLVSEQVPLPLTAAGLAVLIVDTRSPHRHATNEYAVRRATCEAAASTLGLPALRDVTDLDAALAALPDEVSRKRVRHIVTENVRVGIVVAHLRAGRLAAIGPLLTASHTSLRDDFEVSVPELDTAVEAALAAGALGARMTGGGFGGCVLALVEAAAAPEVMDEVAKAFAGRGFTAPAAFVAAASPGTSRVD
jgi:galactokinase